MGASGKLGQYMVKHSLDRGSEVVGVCRPASVATDDREVIERTVAGCEGALVVLVLVPRGVHGYATGTAQAVLDYAAPEARFVFSCGWHITLDGQDVYSWKLKALVKIGGPLAKFARFADLDDQVEACRRVFASDTRWTVVRGSDLEEGESQGCPCGAGMWATRFWRATSHDAWTSPSSWSRCSSTTSSSTKRRRSWVARLAQHSRTPLLHSQGR